MAPAIVMLGAVLVGGAVIAITAGAHAAWRAIGLALATALLAAPFVAEGPGLLRGLIALACVIIFFRAVDLARMEETLAPARRVWHALGVVDTRRVTRTRAALSSRSVIRIVGFGVAAALGLAVAVGPARALRAGPALTVRWLAGVVFAYAIFEVLVATIELVYRALGLAAPTLHDEPIQSRTVEEFWGRRWNRVVSGWLRSTLFLPLARRGVPRLGVIAAFAVSVALHAYVAWAALDARRALVVSAFFALQVPILELERALRVARWPASLGRAWTIGVLLAASPLFVLPVLDVFTPLFR